jgi:hypothetical protein
MPENKEQKMVDIDTSGPEVDVELKDDSSKETPEVETVEATEQEEVKEPSSSTLAEKTSSEKQETSDEKKESTKDELEQYSEGVQRRIAKLTKKMREAERQKDEALRYAHSVKAEKDLMDKRYSTLETSSIKDRELKIKAAVEAAKSKLAFARENNDLNAEVEISKEIARLGYEEARMQEVKDTAAAMPQVNNQTTSLDAVRARQAYPIPQNIPTDEKAEDWATRNTWFGKDKAMTYTAFDIHKTLVDEEGYDPKSDEYYAEINKRIRLEFPQKFATTETKESTKPTQTVASGKRSVKNSRKTVRLTPSQVAIAKKLGVPLEEYAKQLNITKEV